MTTRSPEKLDIVEITKQLGMDIDQMLSFVFGQEDPTPGNDTSTEILEIA